ncbi:MAG TPA: sugar phosphate isomerase/epimerase family protein [Candidatus Hydrogenedentes bacterium]|nr:MAG: Hydroxypyruvate isomerase [Candidatus Hydrogenedentes bacterium ADurb.Bin170]HNZ48304.1 sugar phosphate isomerase/epimerase family protein [Candidatus Hydrogenedentota bacterium]HPX85045.1 sugar phosphate isomerase/epimerase family protein [Candidatus Hydrogenedentota bacterium]
MNSTSEMTRRNMLAALAAVSGAALVMPQGMAQEKAAVDVGRLKQSVSKWCFDKIPLVEFCQAVKPMGITGIDLLSEGDWETVAGEGLVCAMANGPGNIGKGWNRIEHHEELIANAQRLIPKAGDLGVPNMVVFSGNRRGQDDETGLENCAKGLAKILPLAEKAGVVLCMELLNSKRNHKDYQCDHTAWGARLAKKLDSPNFKLLYDIYHMQIMEGDVIATIEENIKYIGHIHTGGVPGRNEIDDTQELNYPRICSAIADTGFSGFLAHEFVPKAPDPLESLRQAIAICRV